MSQEKKNHTNSKKELYKNQKLGHSKGSDNADSQFQGVSPDTPTQIGGTRHSQVPSGPGASPNRARFSEPKLIKENGSTHFAHVTNIPKKGE
ncbi:MAG TPA: hypothetical protein VN939_05855 [Chthoniobacterales bacterium]|jgi:hypothetical protein|nr:hypothetical protein [Chthoniobacterales bacterium]